MRSKCEFKTFLRLWWHSAEGLERNEISLLLSKWFGYPIECVGKEYNKDYYASRL